MDLAIANMAILGKKAKDGSGRFENLNIVAGGVEIALPQCKGSPPTFAKTTADLFCSHRPDEIGNAQLVSSLNDDLKLDQRRNNPGQMTAFRMSLLVGFLQKFQIHLTAERVGVKDPVSLAVPRGHQLFQKVPQSQPGLDPVERPLPHLSSALQVTGAAVYVDDIPAQSGEVQLVPLQSNQPHAHIVDVDVRDAVRVPGVWGWISAKDVPGVNLWGWCGDEEVFASEKVVHVGQIIGCIAADTKRAGLEAVGRIRV